MSDRACAHPLAARLEAFYSPAQNATGAGLVTELLELVERSGQHCDALSSAAAVISPLPEASQTEFLASQQLLGALCDALADVPGSSYAVSDTDDGTQTCDALNLRQHEGRATAALLIAAALARKMFMGLDLEQPELDEFGDRRGRQQLYATAQIEEVEDSVSKQQQVGSTPLLHLSRMPASVQGPVVVPCSGRYIPARDGRYCCCHDDRLLLALKGIVLAARMGMRKDVVEQCCVPAADARCLQVNAGKLDPGLSAVHHKPHSQQRSATRGSITTGGCSGC
jgi:hypothetical protein